jgi:hypothetical protein
MTGGAALVLVWLGAEPLEGRIKTAIDAWAAEKHYVLEAPAVEPLDTGEAARTVAERCDHDLDLARDQLNAGDHTGARRTLAGVEQTLRDHPELLQASWLMAERWRLEASIAHRGGEDPTRWLERAEAIEGARAAAFGETARAPAEGSVSVDVVVHGARAHETYWDGVRAEDRFSTAKGEHHLAIVRGKRLAWSGWVSALAAAKLDVWVPDASPCSSEDLDGARFASETDVAAPGGVRCVAWAVAAPGRQRGTLRIARCLHATCEPASTWAYEVFSPGAVAEKKGFPKWAAWTAAGVGVAAAASFILWQTGAFDRSGPSQRVVYDGRGL